MVVKVKDTLQSPLSLKCDRSRVSIPHLLPSPYHRATPYLIFSYWGLGGIPPRPSKKQRPAPPAGGGGQSRRFVFSFFFLGEKKKKTRKGGFFFFESSGGRIRTYNPLLTLVPMLPLGVDYIIIHIIGCEALPGQKIFWQVLLKRIVST